jgi:predicted metal-dependent hydrolase
LMTECERARAAAGDRSGRIQLALDTDEATAVLAILDKLNAKEKITDADWNTLFSTEPYIRLKKREASFHRDFTDEDFKTFVLSPELSAKREALRQTLEEWKKKDLRASAERVLTYLPEQATIRAKIYPVIKPRTNSFVFETETDPAIFLYLDPAESAAEFENTVAHELHHIGFSSVRSGFDEKLHALPPNVQPAVEWMGAFGEGFAMLAAAGSPDVHPHAVSPAQERARWDRDMANFNQDLGTLQEFFLDIVNQKFKTKDEINEKAASFFGEQGPWYTVGYKMAVIVEKRYGRATLIECMIDPRELLARYSAAAAKLNQRGSEKLALWSPELLSKIGVPAL